MQVYIIYARCRYHGVSHTGGGGGDIVYNFGQLSTPRSVILFLFFFRFPFSLFLWRWRRAESVSPQQLNLSPKISKRKRKMYRWIFDVIELPAKRLRSCEKSQSSRQRAFWKYPMTVKKWLNFFFLFLNKNLKWKDFKTFQEHFSLFSSRRLSFFFLFLFFWNPDGKVGWPVCVPQSLSL